MKLHLINLSCITQFLARARYLDLPPSASSVPVVVRQKKVFIKCSITEKWY